MNPDSAYRQLKKFLLETGPHNIRWQKRTSPDMRAVISDGHDFHDLRHPNVKPKTQIFLHKINLHFAALVIFYCPQYYVVLRYDRALLIDAIFLQIEIALMYRLL